jgi:glycosyltransferase involved in cell wall biosynthesis
MTPRRVVYVQYANPAAYPPLQHSAAIFAAAAWDVELLGITQPRVEGLEFARHARIAVRLMPPSGSGWRQKLHYLRFCLWTLSEIRRHRPTWVYASDTLSAPVAFFASLMRNVRLVYHEHDAPDERNRSSFMRALLALRRRVLQRAQLVVVPNAERGRSFREAGTKDDSIFCVWNCPQQDEAATTPRADGGDAFWLIYHGSIVPARLPESVVRALAEVPKVNLRVRGYGTAGHENYVEHLLALARQLGVESRVDVKLLVPTREALFDDVRKSDLGLSLMPSGGGDLNERNMTGASNKAFEYLSQGVPLLVSELPDWRQMFVERGVARACCPEDPHSIAAAVAWFVEHQREAQSMGERGRQLVLTEWNYERQFAPVFQRMQLAS